MLRIDFMVIYFNFYVFYEVFIVFLFVAMIRCIIKTDKKIKTKQAVHAKKFQKTREVRSGARMCKKSLLS